MKRNIIYFLLVFFQNMLFAQSPEGVQSPLNPNPIPPSPQAAALGKYGEIPINYYTGTADISVPIYTIQEGNIQIPIQLRYNTGGFKVDEIASSVGLGWTLHASGVVTRVTKGLPDDSPNGILFNELKNQLPPTLTQEQARKIHQRILDGEPDIFIISAPSLGGKFVFDANTQTIVSLPKSDLKIEPIWEFNTIEGWAITNTTGITYIFGKEQGSNTPSIKETTSLIPVYGTMTTVTVSAWNLVKIIDNNSNKFVEFKYQNEIETIQQPNSVTESKIIFSSGDCNLNDGIEIQDELFSSQRILSNIIWNQGNISFLYDDRIDLTTIDNEPAKKLSVIKINNSSNILSKFFELEYDYFTSQENDKRLKLLSIQEFSAACMGLATRVSNSENGCLISNPYQFDYIDQLNIEFPTLINNKNQDHWGYFNNKGNTTLIPKEPDISSQTLIYFANGANRESDEKAMKEGMLQIIKYPTGSSTELEYEGNTTNNNSDYVKKTLELHISVVNSGNFVSKELFSDYIDIGSNDIEAITNRIIIESTVTGCNTLEPPILTWELETGNGGEVKDSPTIPYGIECMGFPTITNGKTCFCYKSGGDYKQAKGVIRVKAYAEALSNGSIISGSVKITYYTKRKPSDPIENMPVGGLRIKKLKSFDNINSEPLIKKFFYNLENSEKSSGYVSYFPSYEHSSQEDHMELVYLGASTIYVLKNCNLVLRSSQSQTLLGSGTNMGYSRIEVWEGENAENGKTIYEFTSAKEYPDLVSNNFPYTYVSREHLRGLTTKISSLNKDKILITETTNEYELIGTPKHSSGFVVGIEKSFSGLLMGVQGQSFLGFYNFSSPTYTAKNYDIFSILLLNTKSIQRNYVFSLSQYFEKKQIKEYASYNHYQPTKTTIIDSKGSEIITEFYYSPDNYADGTSNQGLTNLTNKNIIGNPIEIIVSKKETPTSTPYELSKQKSVFKNVNNIPVLDKYYLSTSSNPYEERANYSLYDNFGNTLEFQKTSDVPTSRIYSYSNSYPIAQVNNAAYSDIAYTSFETSDMGNWSYSGLTTSGLSKTGQKYYALTNGAISKTGLDITNIYLVSFWAKGSGVVLINGQSLTISGTEWKLYQQRVSNVTDLTISSSSTSIYVDELRLHPVDAQMTTYTYQPLIGISSQTDAANRSTYYEYDVFGRLKTIKDDEGNLLKAFEYHYSGQE